jgi:hypothetical protein
MTRFLRGKLNFRAAVGLGFVSLLLGASVAAQPQDQQQPQQQQQQPPPSVPNQTQPQPAQKPAAGQSADTPDKPAQKDDRIFGVMPNHLTVENGARIEPLTWKGKFKITAEGAFDPYEFVIVGLVAGIHQAQNTDAPFGQGLQGYAKRYGAGFGDQAIANMMTGAVFPSLLRTDPRYFRMGEGTLGARLRYSLTRIFITRTDSGRRVFNVSEFAGNAAAAGISNAYYPSQDRTISNNLNTWGTQIAIDCLGNELKEFWPDIHHMLRKK